MQDVHPGVVLSSALLNQGMLPHLDAGFEQVGFLCS